MTAPGRFSIMGGNMMEFQIPDPNNRINSGYSVDWDNAHTIRYARGGLNGNQVIRTNLSTGQITVMSNDVTGLAFVQNGSVVTVTISSQRALANGQLIPAVPLALSGQAEIRNPS